MYEKYCIECEAWVEPIIEKSWDPHECATEIAYLCPYCESGVYDEEPKDEGDEE